MTSEDIEFSLFPKLPAEIRAMIWTMSFMSKWGRMVEVRNHEVHYLEVKDFDSKINPDLHLWSPSPPPEIVNICHESRDVAKRVAMREGQFLFQRIFFDPAIDTLYVPKMEKDSPAAQTDEDPYSAYCHKLILDQLATVIKLEEVRFYARDLESNTYGMRVDLHMLTQLKKITFVVPGYHAHLLMNRRKYFQYSRRMVSSLAALEACKVRRAEEDLYYQQIEVCRLAIRNGGNFTLVEPMF